MATIGQQLLQPEMGWKRYDDRHNSIKYTGNWLFENTTGYYNGTVSHVNQGTSGARVDFCFYGTKIRIIANWYTNKPTNVKIIIDGVQETFSEYTTITTPTQHMILSYEKIGLENKIHKVEVISPDDMTGKSWNIDAIDIGINDDLIRHDYFDTNWEEPMRKYGIGWYGFDEHSGDTKDKLGSNYIGSIANANRVQGWNNKGYALNFNGTSSVLVQVLENSLKLPSIGGLTMRFKFKCNTFKALGMYLVASLNSFNNQKGMTVYIFNGKLGIGWTTNTAGNYCFDITSDIDYLDNKWHDLFFSWDGLANSMVYLYVDNMVEPVAKVKAQYSNNGHLYPNFNIGRLAGITSGWFTGQIDDFQLYNKALLPSEFPQKRLAVKTVDKKNLVLSNTSTRVQEIPDVDEITLIDKGNIIQEIDSSIDRPSIDLTKVSNEYEIVNNTKTTLGTGKLFTIPIDNFKTAIIEDNY